MVCGRSWEEAEHSDGPEAECASILDTVGRKITGASTFSDVSTVSLFSLGAL